MPPIPNPSDGPKVRGVRPGGRSQRVREAILAAAVDELVAVGYGELSMLRVAERAGVAVTTVYRRWPSKSQLLAGIVAERAVPPAEIDTGRVEADLRLFAASVAAVLSDATTVVVMRSALALPEAELDPVREAVWHAREPVGRAIVERAVARGELPGGVDARRVVELIAAPIWARALVTAGALDEPALGALVDDALAVARTGA